MCASELALVGRLLTQGKSPRTVATTLGRPYTSARKAARRLRAGDTGLAKQRDKKGARLTPPALEFVRDMMGREEKVSNEYIHVLETAHTPAS